MNNNEFSNFGENHFMGDENAFNWFLEDPSTNFLSSNNNLVPLVNPINLISPSHGYDPSSSSNQPAWLQSSQPLPPPVQASTPAAVGNNSYDDQHSIGLSSPSSILGGSYSSTNSTNNFHSPYNFSAQNDGMLNNIFSNYPDSIISPSYQSNYNCFTPSPPPPPTSGSLPLPPGSQSQSNLYSSKPMISQESQINVSRSPTLLQSKSYNSTGSLKTPPPLKYFGDLLMEREDQSTRSSSSSSSTPSIIQHNSSLDHHHMQSADGYPGNNRMAPALLHENSQNSNYSCDSILVSSTSTSSTNNTSSNNNSLIGGNSSTTDGGISPLNRNFINCSQSSEESSSNPGPSSGSWDKSIPEEFPYSFDPRSQARFVNLTSNHSINVNSAHFAAHHKPSSTTTLGFHSVVNGPSRPPTGINFGQRPILPTSSPIQNGSLPYPYQRPIAIQANLGYNHKIAPPRFFSPYMTTNVAGRDIIVWSSTRTPTNRVFSQQTTSSVSHHHLHHTHMASFSTLPDLTGSQAHNRLPIMISAGRVAFTSQVDDCSSPSSTCSTSSSSISTNGVNNMVDKKIFMNNPLLVNMLTCPQIPGLRNLAPAPDSSSSHFDEKSKNEILSGLLDMTGERRKRSARSLTTSSTKEPVKREMRPKIFDIEQFRIGRFFVQSSNEGTRRGSSTQLKVIFSKRRFIYEFAYSSSFTCDRKDSPNILAHSSSSIGTKSNSPNIMGNDGKYSSTGNLNNNLTIQSNTNSNGVVYYVIAVPFEIVTGLNIEDSTMYLTVDRVPFLFGGTSVRSKVLFEKAPRFDPSQGELESNGLHCICLKASQVGRLRNSLIDFDERFSFLLAKKIPRDSFSYRGKLSDTNKEINGNSQKDEESIKGSNHNLDSELLIHGQSHNQLQSQNQNSHLPTPSKKPRLIEKTDYDRVESSSPRSNNLVDLP